MALAFELPTKVDMPLKKETKPRKRFVQFMDKTLQMI